MKVQRKQECNDWSGPAGLRLPRTLRLLRLGMCRWQGQGLPLDAALYASHNRSSDQWTQLGGLNGPRSPTVPSSRNGRPWLTLSWPDSCSRSAPEKQKLRGDGTAEATTGVNPDARRVNRPGH